jgi:hypothetical protein
VGSTVRFNLQAFIHLYLHTHTCFNGFATVPTSLMPLLPKGSVFKQVPWSPWSRNSARGAGKEFLKPGRSLGAQRVSFAAGIVAGVEPP